MDFFDLQPIAMTHTVNITRDTTNGGFGMQISDEGVVTGYSVPGGAAEVRDGGYVLRRRPHARWRCWQRPTH
eukprot:COSAG06_NODE_2084_length_7635_cov_1.676221_3_plen_72_part_00